MVHTVESLAMNKNFAYFLVGILLLIISILVGFPQSEWLEKMGKLAQILFFFAGMALMMIGVFENWLVK